MKLSVVIPVYNEEDCLEKSLGLYLDYLKKQEYEFEIIIVDDGSIDRTKDILKNIDNNKIRVISHQKNQGKGKAIKSGMLAGKGDWLLFIDADNASSIDHLDLAWPQSKVSEVIVGTRNKIDAEGASQVTSQSRLKRLMGSWGNQVIRLLSLNEMHDTQCGFKLFSKKASSIIFNKTKISRWATDIEMLLIAKNQGIKIAIIPIKWHHKDNSKVTCLGYLQTLSDIFRIKMNDLKGLYR